jgi:hypothetical protein
VDISTILFQKNVSSQIYQFFTGSQEVLFKFQGASTGIKIFPAVLKFSWSFGGGKTFFFYQKNWKFVCLYAAVLPQNSVA